MDVPCDGIPAAEALSKRLLQECGRLGSCDNMCKVVRKDATIEEPGTCNYVVIEDDEEAIRQLLIPLYEDKLELVVGELLSHVLHDPDTQAKEKLESVPMDQDLRTFLSSTEWKQTITDFAGELGQLYAQCNEHQPSNTKDVLRKQLEGLRKAGVPDLMESTMPAAAQIVRHYESFLSLLK